MRTTAFLSVFVLAIVPAGAGEEGTPKRGDEPSYPVLVTEQTRRDKSALAALERPGRIVFQDGFESPKSLEKYFEIRGEKEGHAVLETDAQLAHSGHGAIRFTAAARDGKASGAGAHGWLGREGYDRLYFRRYIKFAEDYDQGDLNHTGGGLAGVAGDGKWDGMGQAGIRPTGEDRFTSRFEPWRDWGRYAAPGYMFSYTYWMDMKPGRAEGQHWGNMLGPLEAERVVPERGRWVCLEQMIKVNTIGKADGELAAWIDGKLYLHYRGFRWRKTERLRLKRFSIDVYVHRARQANVVWYDDVALSTGYIGPVKKSIVADEPVIVDHRSTDLSRIPEAWIEKAKQELHIAYGHTSHGSQLTTGMAGLAKFKGSLFAWNNGGGNGALDLRDRPMRGANDLGSPDRRSWAAATRTYLATNPSINVVIWSWCGQASTTTANIDIYLTLMEELIREYPTVRFVFMTGHLDGGGLRGRLHLANEHIRQHCKSKGRILYDFADIESYDPDGNYFGDKRATDGCSYDSNGDGTRDRNWARDWQEAHEEGVDWYSCPSAHSQPLNANRKAYAAWWLWARLAGWPGEGGSR